MTGGNRFSVWSITRTMTCPKATNVPSLAWTKNSYVLSRLVSTGFS